MTSLIPAQFSMMRVDSFKNWPRSIPVKPLELSVAGFYYTGISDKVICPVCTVYVQNWGVTDIPLKKHKTYCKFLCAFKGLQKYLEFEERLKSLRKWNDRSNRENVEEYARAGFYYSAGELRYVTNKDITLYKNRLLSFEGCPKQEHPLKQINEKKAARMGFLYSGVDTKVIHISNCDILIDFKRNVENTDNRALCKVCLNDEIQTMFIPCRHAATCLVCSSYIRFCCICRNKVDATSRIFI